MMNLHMGVVEDRMDPEQMGRVRVRIFGLHSPNKQEVPTNTLPWATVLMPTTSTSTSGLGFNPFLVEGTWVALTFNDDAYQDPIILGTVAGKPAQKRSADVGFSDPNGEYPRYLDEPDTNKLARGINTIPHEPDAAISEPANPYAAEYPFNRVYESESGHVKEYDDTTDAERIREHHRSGTEYEIHPNGDRVVTVVGDGYRVVAGNDSVHVSGNVNLIIDGNCTTRIEGNWDVDVTGEVSIDANMIYLNRDNGNAWAAARLGDTADTGDAGGGGHFDTNSAGTDKIETGSGTVFIGQ
jgi:hypothetical protein